MTRGRGARTAAAVALGVCALFGPIGGTSLEGAPGRLPAWVKVDAAHRRVAFRVVAAETGANGTLNFNGYANGQMTVTVPVGWHVHIDFVNSGAGALPHSLEVIRDTKTIPPQGVPPAIPKAETRDLVAGVPPQQSDSLDFTAAPAGRYLWFCGVPSHGISGMWDRFVVSASAKVPSVLVRGGP
jgi:sulfocyanin